MSGHRTTSPSSSPAILRVGLLVLLCAGLLTACRHVGQPPAARAARKPIATNTLVIAAWNMEWLGNTNRRPHQPDPQAVAEYIRKSRASVIALEEICETEPHSLKNVILDQTVHLLSTNGQAWAYKMFDCKTSRGQNCGVMWNSTAVKPADGGAPFELPVDRTPSPELYPKWDRAPYAIQFSAGPGKTDFVLIPVHMKSNVREPGKGDTAQHRAAEARALAAVLDQARQHYRARLDLERDILILGDFNTLGHSEPAIAAYEAAGFLDLNPQDVPTEKSARYEPAPFDRILVPNSQPEFAARKFMVVNDGYQDSLSDHHMVETEILILPDDD